MKDLKSAPKELQKKALAVEKANRQVLTATRTIWQAQQKLVAARATFEAARKAYMEALGKWKP